jgi:RimK family alpha-L-glutamate ligase
MVGWLIYSRSDVEKNKSYIQFYIDEGKLRNISIRLVLAEDLVFGIQADQWYIACNNETVTRPDFAICRTIYPLLNKQLELMGIPVFNNSLLAEICNDKAKTYQYVAQLGIPMVDTEFCKNSFIRDRLAEIKDPTVIKAVAGHGGSQVFLVQPGDTTQVENFADGIMQRLKGADAVIQPLIGSRHQDLRVYVIGNKIICAVLRTAKEGFKSNFSLGGEVRLYDLSFDEISLVKRIINLFEIGMAGIDFIIGDNGELIFNEIEDVVGARMLYQCTDINLVGLYLDYIVVNMTWNK